MSLPAIAAVGGLLQTVLTQVAASKDAPNQRFSEVLTEKLSATEEFLKYQKMTPAEKFRASYLSEKGLDEDDLKAMSPEERMKIEKEITERIREKLAQSASRAINS